MLVNYALTTLAVAAYVVAKPVDVRSEATVNVSADDSLRGDFLDKIAGDLLPGGDRMKMGDGDRLQTGGNARAKAAGDRQMGGKKDDEDCASCEEDMREMEEAAAVLYSSNCAVLQSFKVDCMRPQVQQLLDTLSFERFNLTCISTSDETQPMGLSDLMKMPKFYFSPTCNKGEQCSDDKTLCRAMNIARKADCTVCDALKETSPREKGNFRKNDGLGIGECKAGELGELDATSKFTRQRQVDDAAKVDNTNLLSSQNVPRQCAEKRCETACINDTRCKSFTVVEGLQASADLCSLYSARIDDSQIKPASEGDAQNTRSRTFNLQEENQETLS